MSAVNQALELISSADLSPTEHKLLSHFVNAAVSPDLAARYLLSRTTQNSPNDVETRLRHLKQDWQRLSNLLTKTNPVPAGLEASLQQRDGPGCFVTKAAGKPVTTPGEPAHVIPPSLLQDTADSPVYQEILDVFLTPSYVSQMRTLLSTTSRRDSLKNLWLLSPEFHRAVRVGNVETRTKNQRLFHWHVAPELTDTHGNFMVHKIFPEQCSDIILGDGSKIKGVFFFNATTTHHLPLPSGVLLDIHRRFATALHLFFVEDRATRAWPRQSADKQGGLSDWLKGFVDIPRLAIRRMIHWMWLCLPEWLRFRFYVSLIPIGLRLYGHTSSSCAHLLPFGLVIKESREETRNEANALRMVEEYTSIPAPRLVDVGEYNGQNYVVMTLLPGKTLHEVFHLMSYQERNRFADDLSACVAQLRQIPNKTPYKFANTIGGRIYDPRISCPSDADPCNTEAEFYDILTAHHDCTAEEAFGEEYASLRQDHRSFFTHSDLHASNILIENGCLCGIVDWEAAGYKPEYWEFTKAFWFARGHPEWEAFFRRVFGHQYEAELKIEKLLWLSNPFP